MSTKKASNPSQQLEELQTLCSSILNEFDKKECDINRALQHYKYILTHYKNKTLYSEKCRRYIFNKFLEPSSISLMTRKHEHFQRDYNMADGINRCCKLLISIVVPLIKYDDPLAFKIINICINRTSPFYIYFGHSPREYKGNKINKINKSMLRLPHMVSWRHNLGITANNNRCDVLNIDDNIWCHCSIIDIDSSTNRIKINYDAMGNNFFFDEWISRDDIRLQPLHDNINNIDINRLIEDTEDPNDDNIFAIYRGKIGNESYYLVDIINEFGKCGGFDAILEGLLSIHSLSLILSPLSKCWRIYSKQFADKWLPKIPELVDNTLESLRQREWKDFTCSDCEEIIGSLNNALRRYHSDCRINEFLEELTLEMILRRLQCGREDAAIQIAELCATSNRQTNITSDALMNWIKTNKILQYLFGFSNVILCKSDILIIGYIKSEIYYNYYSNNNDDILSMDILLLIQLYYNHYTNAALIQHSVKVLEFINRELFECELENIHIEMIWNTLISVCLPSNRYNKTDQLAMCQVICKLYHIIGQLIMNRCIDNFIQHKYVIATIRILTGIWSLINKNMRYKIIGYMIDNKKLLKYYCRELIYFKNYVKNYIHGKKINIHETEKINDIKLCKDDKLNYLDNITARIKFLQYISIKYTDLKLKDDEKHILYTYFIQNAFTEKERKIAIPILPSIVSCR